MKCQQFELYAAEAGVEPGRGFRSGADLQHYVDELRESDYWQRGFPQVKRVEAYVRPPSWRGGSVGAWREHYGGGIIEMAQCHLNELAVLHEVSHVLAAARYGSGAHDPWFARTYLELVYTTLGPKTYDALRTAFSTGGVDFEAEGVRLGGVEL
jgi:putative metallohydrolase (TIGR04338 family)